MLCCRDQVFRQWLEDVGVVIYSLVQTFRRDLIYYRETEDSLHVILGGRCRWCHIEST
jgi:hypothetical protein